MSIYQQIFNQSSSSTNIYGFLKDKGFKKVDDSRFEKQVMDDLKIKINYNDKIKTLHLRVFYRDVQRSSVKLFHVGFEDIDRVDNELRDTALAISINEWM